MLLSVFTPSHKPSFLDDAYRSLEAQTLREWEWIVLLNGAARDWRPPVRDERVKVVRNAKVRGVGAAKRAACDVASGDILVELDHDDVLSSTGLADIAKAFDDDPTAVLVYSDFAQVNRDLSSNDERWANSFGWEYDEVEVDGTVHLRCRAMLPSPHNVSYIWYAPNHVRAFRRNTYEKVGGYDASLHVLDDQDLMTRLYIEGDFHHIPRCLYLQRMHGNNTQADRATNEVIQTQTVHLYRERIVPMASAWAQRSGLEVLHVGVGDTVPGEAAPRQELPGVDATTVTTVAINPAHLVLDYADNSVGLIIATDVLQHLPNRSAFFNECYRVLAHGGLIVSETPSTDGRGAFQDPSFVSFYNENSFWYLTQSALRASLPELHARLQISYLGTSYPTPWHEENDISYVQANLLAVKEGPRQGGPLLS